MTFNQTTVVEYKTNIGTVSTSTITETGNSKSLLDVVIGAGTTNSHSAFSVDVSQVVSFLMLSSQDITIKTNSTGSPDQTFQLLASIGFTWNNTRTNANPLTVDIADLYFTNAGTADATVNLRFLFA